MPSNGVTVSCETNTCNLGESITFKKGSGTYQGNVLYSSDINIYEDDVLIHSYTDFNKQDNYFPDYEYTPSTIGEHIIRIEGGYNTKFQITITVTGVSFSSSSINNKEISSLFIKKEIFHPPLTSTSEVLSRNSITCSNGEIVGKGFTVQPGWSNEGLWEASFDFKHDNIRYTGICFVAPPSYNGYGGSSTALTSWEGSFPGTTSYATYSAGSVGYFDITVTKIDETHVKLKSGALGKESTVEVSWLPDYSVVSCGARHNNNSSYGPVRLKNLVVIEKKEVQSIVRTSDNQKIYEKGK